MQSEEQEYCCNMLALAVEVGGTGGAAGAQQLLRWAAQLPQGGPAL